MKKIIVLMAAFFSCISIADPTPKSSRVMGCMEQVLRISESVCQFKHALLPTNNTLPDHLEVTPVDDVPVDVCLRRWEEVAKKCQKT